MAKDKKGHNPVIREECNYMKYAEEKKSNPEEKQFTTVNQKIALRWHKTEENASNKSGSAHLPSEIVEDVHTEAHLAYSTENQSEPNDYSQEERNYLSLEESKLKLEERRITLENQKIALEWHKMEENVRLRELEIINDFNLNVMRLEKEMALKELELKYKYNKE